MSKHISIGKEVKAIFNSKLGDNFTIFTSASSYDYDILIKCLESGKVERLIVSVTKPHGRIQMRVQKPDDSFDVYGYSDVLESDYLIANTLVMQYLKDKQHLVSRAQETVDFHNSLLKSILNT